MAIGSEPEIGVQFSRWGLMSDAAKEAWFKHVVTHWGPDLVGEYGSLIYRQDNNEPK